MRTFISQLGKSKIVVLIFVLGILLQAVYLPYYARYYLIITVDAGYSWIWDQPFYYDQDKKINVSMSDMDAWKAKAKESPPKSSIFDSILGRSGDEIKLPASWIRIEGIDYKRLLLTLSLWISMLAGVFYILKKRD